VAEGVERAKRAFGETVPHKPIGDFNEVQEVRIS